MQLHDALPPETLPLRDPAAALSKPAAGNLVLSRRTGEAIVIDGPCTITLVETGCGRAKLSIVAQKTVRVLRAELIPKAAG